jgi:hypothetical protein
MRNVANAGHARLRGLAIALAVLALGATHASAQLVFDGNLLFNNNASGTLAGQFTGAPISAATIAACPSGYNAVMLGTVTFPHNLYGDPLLSKAPYPTGTPNFQPALGSPAYSQAVVLPNDGFFQQTCYMGAIGPDPADDWLDVLRLDRRHAPRPAPGRDAGPAAAGDPRQRHRAHAPVLGCGQQPPRARPVPLPGRRQPHHRRRHGGVRGARHAGHDPHRP